MVPLGADHDTADEEVEDTTADEGEHEGGISGDLGRDLEFEEAGSNAENDTVAPDDNRLNAEWEEVGNAPQHHEHGGGQVNYTKGIGEIHGGRRNGIARAGGCLRARAMLMQVKGWGGRR